VAIRYVRYQSTVANERGNYPGIFGLANGLARSGRLTEVDHTWWRKNNDWLDEAYPDPAVAHPNLFDLSVNPGATCWFRTSAGHLLTRVPGYLALLDRYDVPWTELQSNDPGRVLYADAVQVVIAARQTRP